jgi:hypothetical protein
VVEIDVIPGAANANPGIAMWTASTRKNYSRKTVRYQSDVTDEEWRVIEPHLPPARTTGRPRAWPLRRLSTAFFTSCAPAARGNNCQRVMIAILGVMAGVLIALALTYL